MAFAAFFSHLPPLLVLLLLSTSLGKKSEQLDKLAKIRAAISSPSSPPRRSAKANVERAVDDDDDSDYRPIVYKTLNDVRQPGYQSVLFPGVLEDRQTTNQFKSRGSPAVRRPRRDTDSGILDKIRESWGRKTNSDHQLSNRRQQLKQRNYYYKRVPLLKQQQPEPVTGVRVTRRSTPRPAPPAVTTATPPSTTTRAPPPPPSIPEASTTSETIFYDFKPREGYIDNDRAESVNNFVNSIYSALSPTSRSPPPPSGNTFYQAVGDSSKSYSPSTTNIKQRPSPPIPTYGGRPTPFSSSSYSSSSSSSTINNQRPIGTRSGSVSSSTSYPAVPSISSYGSPHGTPISASSSSSTSSSRSAFRPASPTYFRGAGTTTGAIWTNQPPQYHQGNVQQTSSINVPPVPVPAKSSSSNNNGPVRSGYYPPSQRKMPRVNKMEAECSDDVMKLSVHFNDSFSGLIYSAGYAYDKDCIYINGTGDNAYDFFIQLNRCGTLGGSDHNKKRDANFKNTEPTKNFMWNTVTIQYSPLIEEEWDEHFKVTCEYGYDFWKTVTFPFLEVEVNTADPVHFTMTPPECHMEIRNGYGTAGTRVAGPVHVGDPLTLMLNMRSQTDGFDILVNDCYAHNGANKRIQLIDHHGCPVDQKLISRFQGNFGMSGTLYQTVVYAHLKTFRFTGTPALYIECDVRMCHGKCPVQSCNWRDSKRRRRRALEEQKPTEDTESLEDFDSYESLSGEVSPTSAEETEASSLSQNVRMFQSIHVLQSRDERPDNETEDGQRVQKLDVDDSVCLSSIILASAVGLFTLMTLLSSATISLLCLRLKRFKSFSDDAADDEDNEAHSISKYNSSNYGGTLKAHSNSNLSGQSLSLKGEYVHSTQQRIP